MGREILFNSSGEEIMSQGYTRKPVLKEHVAPEKKYVKKPKKKTTYSDDNPYSKGPMWNEMRAGLWEDRKKKKKKKQAHIESYTAYHGVSFNDAFKKARKSKDSVFVWKGKKYHTKTKEEVSKGK